MTKSSSKIAKPNVCNGTSAVTCCFISLYSQYSVASLLLTTSVKGFKISVMIPEQLHAKDLPSILVIEESTNCHWTRTRTAFSYTAIYTIVIAYYRYGAEPLSRTSFQLKTAWSSFTKSIVTFRKVNMPPSICIH